MNTLFQPDSRLIRFLTKVCDLLILNIMLILSCMTVVCSGAAVTALYSVTLGMIRGETGSVTGDFLRFLKGSFIPSAPATLLLFLDLLSAALLHYAVRADFPMFSPEVFVLIAIFHVMLTALLSYLFPLISRYDNTFLRHLGNAARLALANLPVTVLLTAVNLFPIWIGFFVPALWIPVVEFWLLIGASAAAYLNSFYLQRIFPD